MRTAGFRQRDRKPKDPQSTRCGLSLLFEAVVQVTRLGRRPDTAGGDAAKLGTASITEGAIALNSEHDDTVVAVTRAASDGAIRESSWQTRL